MKKSLLKNYAKLIAVVGGNIRPGQDVEIFAEPDQPAFVTYLCEECYKAGARSVRVEWSSQAVDRLAARFESQKTLSQVPSWEEELLKERTEKLPVRIKILSADPDGMKGVDRDKLTKAQAVRSLITKPYQDRMTNRYQWCVAAVPSVGWAKKIFPDERSNAAVEKLWQLILETSRAAGKDPLTDWMWHNRALKDRCEKLNAMGLASLEYKSSNGTDFSIALIPEAEFIAGKKVTADGHYFNPNIPTEEVFTTPLKNSAQGLVRATRPLSYGGELIEDFWIRFENGKAVEWGAEENEKLLGDIINMDEGSCYLGECALVPCDSPINKSGILFYNTLFDENAACHLALGRGYTNTVKNFASYGCEQFAAMGINDSSVHVDFMVGTRDLFITGVTKEGARLPIFERGNWAF